MGKELQAGESEWQLQNQEDQDPGIDMTEGSKKYWLTNFILILIQYFLFQINTAKLKSRGFYWFVVFLALWKNKCTSI